MELFYDDNTEIIDDLQVNDLKIIQKRAGFKFGIDAVLLANFVSFFKKESERNVIDLGTGTGIIPILLTGKYGFKCVQGLEIQEEYVELAARNVELNGLKEVIKVIQGDIKNIPSILKRNSFDMVVANPPYKNKGSGIINKSDSKSLARHEILCNFEDVVAAVKYLLKPNGSFIFIHRPDRLVDLIYLMRKYKVEPKYIKFVYSSVNKKATKLVLIKGVNNGNTQLNFMEPLFVYDDKYNYTKEVNDIYFGGR